MTTPAEIAHFQTLEETLWRAETRFDRVLMEQTFAPEFFEFGRSGRVWSREACLSVTAQPISVRLPFAAFAVLHVAANVVLVTYASAVTYDGVEEFANRSSLWRRDGAAWRLVFHQGTPCAEFA